MEDRIEIVGEESIPTMSYIIHVHIHVQEF